MNRIAMQCIEARSMEPQDNEPRGIAVQSNAASPLRGFVESFWLKRTATQLIALKSKAAQ